MDPRVPILTGQAVLGCSSQGPGLCHSAGGSLVAPSRLARASRMHNMAKTLSAGYPPCCVAQAVEGFAMCFILPALLYTQDS